MLVCDIHALNDVLFLFSLKCMNCHEHHVYHDDTLHPTDAKI
jgi:hypothetical protein